MGRTSRMQGPIVVSLVMAATILHVSCSTPIRPTLTPPVPSRTLTHTPIAGTLTGRILTADGKPLVDIQEETGIVMLVCTDSSTPGTCLDEDDLDLDVSVLVASICRPGDTASNCLLHWLRNAAPVEEDGSYTMPFAPPGQYDLLLVITDRLVVGWGWAVQIRFVNVDPIEAGETTEYSPSMATQIPVETAAPATMTPEEPTPTSTPESTAAPSPTNGPSLLTATVATGSERIAFQGARNGNTDIYTVNADGNSLVRLTTDPGGDWNPVWSPDGKRIAFEGYHNGNQDIYIVDDSGQSRLTNDPAVDMHPAWSPDGKHIAFDFSSNANTDIYVLKVDGGGQMRLTNDPATDRSAAWSPDGMHILFISYRHDDDGDIFIMNADGSGQTRLTDNPYGDWNPVWSPDGKRIAYEAVGKAGGIEIYAMNADGSDQRNLSRDPSGATNAPAWSPDGKQIAFFSYRDGNGEIYVMNADGSGQRNLTNHPGRDWGPVWSPDGKRIAFVSYRDGNHEIYVMNADGSGQTRLTNNLGQDTGPVWSPAINLTDSPGDDAGSSSTR